MTERDAGHRLRRLLLLVAVMTTVLPTLIPFHPTLAASLPQQRLEPSLPEAREEVASAALGGKLYVIAGFDAAGADRQTVFVFDGRHWTRGPNLPVAVDHAAAATLDGKLYVAGGFVAGTASSGVYVLSRSGRSWQTTGSLHVARGALALIALHHALFVLGGKDGADTEISAAESFNPRTGKWAVLSALPLPRDHLAGFASGGWACAAGGRTPTTSRVDCYDPSHHGWRRLPDLPSATSGAGAATLSGAVLVGGGEDAGEGVMVPQLARWSGKQWTSATMLIPRHGLQLVAYRGRVWACGGGTSAGLHATATCTSIQ